MKTFLRFPLALAAVAAAVSALASVEHRESPLTVQVRSKSGAPIADAEVSVTMLNHAFRFGTAVNIAKLDPDLTAYDPTTVEYLEKYFNSITFENAMKWAEYEGRSEARNLELVEIAKSYNAFDGPDKQRLRGHATIWGSAYSVPTDVRNMADPAAIRARIFERIEDFHSTMANERIDNFDLFNEPFHERALLIDKLIPDATLEQEATEYASWFKAAKEADPDATLFINEYNILNFWRPDDADVKAYKELIDAIRDAGGPIDGIGLQAHMDRMVTKEALKRRLDILAARMAPTANHPEGLPGLAIEITELDVNTSPGAWDDATEEEQAQLIENVLEAAWEHPSVQGVTTWVMNTGDHWRDNAVLFDENWELREGGQVWIDHVLGEWWSDASGSSDASGAYQTSVVKGTHKITVTVNGETKELTRSITEEDTVIFEFSVPPAMATVYDDWALGQVWEDEADAVADSDPDGDGRSNREEFYYGSNPLARDKADEVWLVRAGTDEFSLRYKVRAASAGLRVELEKWSAADGWEVVTDPEPTLLESEGGVSTYAIPVEPGESAILYRLEIDEAAVD